MIRPKKLYLEKNGRRSGRVHVAGQARGGATGGGSGDSWEKKMASSDNN